MASIRSAGDEGAKVGRKVDDEQEYVQLHEEDVQFRWSTGADEPAIQRLLGMGAVVKLPRLASRAQKPLDKNG